MAQTVNNVSAAKPAVGGAVSVAATSATLPTSTGGTLTGFTNLGYISEDGLKNANSPESEEIKAWGGDVVLTPLTGKKDTFTFTLIEALNLEVLKVIYGSSNATGTSLSSGYTVNAKAAEMEAHAWVIDMILRNNVAKRVVIPDGVISEIGEVTYADGEAIGYEITVTAFPNSSGVTHYEYIKG
ncbi:MAG: phage tail protein [Oscillospiraceae bacterium]|nr:phage tail protein [Oscillospiraceae bacterium]